MAIRQMNASYLLQEDRILFRVATHDDAEYRFWFTRRVALFILAASDKLLLQGLEKMHDKEVAQAIADFSQGGADEALKTQNSSPATPAGAEYVPGTNYPIGVDPLLVHDVRCTLVSDGLSIDLVLPGGGQLNLSLPMPLLRMMRSLLATLAGQASWGVFAPLTSASADPVDVHQDSEPKVRQIH